MTQAYLDKLETLNIPVIEAKVTRIDSMNGEIRCMSLEGGMQLDCERLYFAIGQYPADDLGVQLGCERDEQGHLVVKAGDVDDGHIERELPAVSKQIRKAIEERCHQLEAVA